VRATLAALIRPAVGSQKWQGLHVQARWFGLVAILCTSLAPIRASAQVAVTVSPSAVNLSIDATQQFTATVTGASDTSVTWSIQEGAAGGAISSSGAYTAPGAVGVYHVVATSNSDNTAKAIATVGLPGFAQTGLINPNPCTATLLGNGTVLYTGGGLPGNGFATSPAEIYNPAAQTSAATGSMTIVRCFETATTLPNGQVLFAGGQSSGGPTATAEIYDPVAGMFTTTASMGFARQGHTATLLSDGTVLIAGGTGNCGGSPCTLNTAELYNPASGMFTPTNGKMATPYSGAAAILLNTGQILIAGGGNTFAELYDPSSGSFSQTAAAVNPPAQCTATLLQNGTVLFTGGVAAGAVSADAEIYDPIAGTFTATGSLNIPRDLHTATLLANGEVLIAGGNSTFSRPAAAELYDPVSGTFRLTGNLEETRFGQSATALSDGTVLIAGGVGGQALASIEAYDPSAGTFSSQSVFLNVPRTGHATTQLADGRLLLTGGEDAVFDVNSSAEIFNPSTETFSFTGPLIQGRYGHTATLLGDGNVLIVGGYTDKNGAEIAVAAEIYNPAAGTFSPAPSNPNIPRAYHTATLLGTGQVLIAGGQIGGQQTTSSVEFYDPVAGTFTPAENMDAPRYNHTATLLNDGRVLIVDGVSGEGPIGAQAAPDDIYDPNTGLFTPVGPPRALQNIAVMPFDSVLLADGQVLADNQTIFDPTSNTLSSINSPVNTVDSILQDYKFALLPSNQVFATSNSYPTYLFGPIAETFSASASLQYFRTSPTLRLLANGEALVAGGAGVAQVEFYVPPVATSSSVPSISSLNPSSAVAGGAGFTLQANGRNFLSNSVVNYNGVGRSTAFVSVAQLSIAITASDILNPGTATITVTNPASAPGGGGTSNPLTFTILAATTQPVVGALIPASITAGATGLTLTVTGSNFTPNSVVSFNGNPMATAFVPPSNLQAAIPASAIAVAGTPLVTVSNPGSPPSTAISFTVNNPVPQATLLMPSNVAAGSAAQLVDVTGIGFNSSSSILVNGSVVATNFVSVTLLQTTLPASDLVAGGTVSIAVNNPGPGGGTAAPALTFTINDYTLTPVTASTTVNAGQPATFSLTLAAANGGTFPYPVTFSAAQLPPNTTASFSPASPVTPGPATQTVTLTLATTPHSYAAGVRRGTPPPALLFLCLAAMACALAWITLGSSGRRMSRLAPQMLLALLLAVVGLAACGAVGGYAAPASPQLDPTTGTPAGPYTITVTANYGSDQHTVTVNLTVM
jgi:galactose oxidase-like protein